MRALSAGSAHTLAISEQGRLYAWGLCSAATALVRTGGQLLLLRFLLGFPEAGFYPAAILTLSLWYPDTSRSRASTLFTLCATRGP